MSHHGPVSVAANAAPNEYRVCSSCVMDTSVPWIRFDQDGKCNYCQTHDELEKRYPLNDIGKQRLQIIIDQIKMAGTGKEYDCVCGVSGGRDSTYTLYLAAHVFGLRPLAVHFDNGWNSDTAATNIRNLCETLDVDLETVVADWDEFRRLQVAFLRASVPDIEVPTDVAIHSVLHDLAAKEGIKYILLGHAFRTEGVAPLDWTYIEGRYVSSIFSQFGGGNLRHYHNFGIGRLIYSAFIKRTKVIPILNYVPYIHKDVNRILEEKVGWTYYGGHHHENYYSKFIQSYILPRKFNIDRRRTEMSALIRSGQMTRDDAVVYLGSHPYECSDELVQYAIEKLDLTETEFDRFMQQPPRSFRDFPNYHGLIRLLRWPLRGAMAVGLISPILYYKFFS